MSMAAIIVLGMLIALFVAGGLVICVGVFNQTGTFITDNADRFHDLYKTLRKLGRDIPVIATDVDARLDMNAKAWTRANSRLAATAEAGEILRLVVLKRASDLRSRGLSPERMGRSWPSYFNARLKSDLNRVVVRG